MYGNNPYLNNFGYGFNMPMQEQKPIQNIINTQPQVSDMFMAKFLKQGERPEDIFVNQQTAFIDLNNKKLSIKELDGKITNYEIILPLDEKDKKIIELEKQINSLKEMMTNGYENATTSNEITEQNGNVKKLGRK